MEKFRGSDGLRRRVLVVDDEFINREILGNILSHDYEVAYAENGKVAYEMLQERGVPFSLILLDLLMPEMDGFAFIDIVQTREDLKDIPIIVMTSEKDAEVKSIRQGAVDFITKPYDMPDVILARCERIIRLSENSSIIRSVEKDDLTGLYTKDFFYEYIRQFEAYNGHREMDAVVVNIAHFHLINEIHGRKKGDIVLVKVAEALLEHLGDRDGFACRLEADTFYVYQAKQDDYQQLLDLIQDSLDNIEDIPKISLRLGVYSDVDKTVLFENWFDRAKLACDRIRGDYLHQIGFYSREMHEKALYHERLINDIDDAILQKDLIVFYQPKYGIQGEEPKLRGAEALIRWKHPELGMISPGDFIPLFESNGLIQKLDRYVWKEAAAQIRKWKETYHVTVPVSVNVSRIDIYDPELENTLLALLEENQLSAGELLLEVTESAYADNVNHLIEVVNSLREKGFRIELDDFGSGYSSLNMLTSIPLDVLKMDMKFVRNMHKDEKSLRLVEIVMDIAKFLNVPVVAEGVEDEKQLSTLKEMGCDVIQGFYFSKPVPPEEFSAFIEKEKNK